MIDCNDAMMLLKRHFTAVFREAYYLCFLYTLHYWAIQQIDDSLKTCAVNIFGLFITHDNLS